MANKGYDIWLGNNRGTVFSYRHVNLTVNDKEYWNFSFNEMGKYDVPTNIDFVLKQTGAEKLTYIGHSQGTTQFWLSNILHDDIGSKIETMIGFAPVMFIGNQSSSAVDLCIDLGIDVWLEDHLNSILWLQDGSSMLNTLIYNYSPYFLEIIPRTTWAFVEAIVGFDKISHMDP
jgi:pimeloyl-ACP methyl ester carboxylesterase